MIIWILGGFAVFHWVFGKVFNIVIWPVLVVVFWLWVFAQVLKSLGYS